MYNPVVSIVMTTYNAEKYLHKQLDSIVNQTYKNIQLFILDDGSSDSTIKIIKNYQNKYKFITLVVNNNRLGVIKNFEKGISLTSSELIALCDHDDIWMPFKIELQVDSIKRYEQTPALVHSDLEIIDAQGMTLYKSFFNFKGYSFPSQKALDILISRSGIMGNTIMFNRALKDLILPFPDNIPMHDYYIGVINEIYGTRITINKPLVKYRIHNQNIGNKKRNIIDKIKGFFSHKLPYLDRKDFLMYLLKKDLTIKDKVIIKDFLNCIKYKKSIVFFKCLNKNYFKNKKLYKVRLFLRYIIE